METTNSVLIFHVRLVDLWEGGERVRCLLNAIRVRNLNESISSPRARRCESIPHRLVRVQDH